MRFYQDFQGFVNERTLTSKEIIGEPFEIDNLEVAEFDFPMEMTLKKAKESCSKLGQGWRLPTGEELKFILEDNKTKLSELHFKKDKYYWSGTEKDGRLGPLFQTIKPSFSKNGKIDLVTFFTSDSDDILFVRAVRG
jgi:hypothetical protein